MLSSKRTRDQDESFQGRNPHIHNKMPFFLVGWYQISMLKVSPFHSGAKMNQQSIYLFIPLQAFKNQKVWTFGGFFNEISQQTFFGKSLNFSFRDSLNSQISHLKLQHVCEQEKKWKSIIIGDTYTVSKVSKRK